MAHFLVHQCPGKHRAAVTKCSVEAQKRFTPRTGWDAGAAHGLWAIGVTAQTLPSSSGR